VFLLVSKGASKQRVHAAGAVHADWPMIYWKTPVCVQLNQYVRGTLIDCLAIASARSRIRCNFMLHKSIVCICTESLKPESPAAALA
jgi:hypothetical protein